MLTRSLPLRSRAAASAPALDLIPFRVEAGSRGRGIPQGAQRLRICRESPLTLPERPSLWLWGWERRERSDRRPQPPSLTAASVGSPEGQSPFGPSAAETNPLASGEALTPRERSDRQQGAKRSAGGTARADERKKLERLCRYISRPAVSEKRLSLTRGGNVRYQLKTPYRDGTTHVIFEPLDFIARLAALVPKPRVNLTRFHGVFAPNSRHRAAGGLLLVPVALVFDPPIPMPTGTNVLGLAWLGLIGAGLTYFLWFRGISRLEPTVVSLLGFLSPGTAVLLGWLFLDQTLSALQIIGVLLVIGSIWLGQRSNRTPRARIACRKSP